MADINFPKNEEDVLATWEREKVFEQTLQREAPQGDFVFYEGPPTANGKPGVHHVLARAFKDAIPRYKTMRGYRVKRKAGWDTHGLPVELQVEKALGISGKPQIETLKGSVKESVEFFNAKCKESVWEHKDLWEKVTTRMGYWVDLSDPYITYKNEYIDSVWSLLKVVDGKKDADGKPMLYRDFRIAPYCTRCGTGLSSHELAQGYKDVTDKTIVIAFTVTDTGSSVAQKGDRILVWTTTPWTLPGNVALAVGKTIKYVRAQGSDGVYIVAEDRLSAIAQQVSELQDAKVLGVYEGAELISASYEPLFPVFDALKYSDTYKVWADGENGVSFVTTEDGTGVVHIAPMYGEDDFAIMKNKNVPKEHTVNAQGEFESSVVKVLPTVAGKFVKAKEVEKELLVYLTDRASEHVYESLHKHSYPHCWRCDTPVLYYAKPSWYIRMSSKRDALHELNEKVGWHPEHIKEGRFGEWIDNVKDWAISRERYWGTPLPIWVNEKDEHIVCTVEDLRAKGVSEDLLQDLHRPFVDEISWTDEKGTWKRVPEVLDVWFDSGAMPWAQYGLDATKIATPDQYPAGFISEAIDQTRGWFYTLMAIAALTDQKESPYKHVICLGHVNDAKGYKMSKSKGNIVDPFMLFEKYGADAVRWHLYTVNAPGESKNFDEKQVRQVITGVFLTLYNTLTFWEMYKGESKQKTFEQVQQMSFGHALDRWQIASMSEAVHEVTEYLEAYDLYNACMIIDRAIDETSTWYLRRSRERIKEGGADAVSVLGASLEVLSRLMAPFAPFIADTISRRVGAHTDSVHLTNWPKAHVSGDAKAVLNAMSAVRDIVAEGLRQRADQKIKVRQPLSSVTIAHPAYDIVGSAFGFDMAQNIIAEELNVKNVSMWWPGTSESATMSVVYDWNITEDLRREGLERELVRALNAERKNRRLKPGELARVLFETDDENIKNILESGSLNERVFASECLYEKDLQESTVLDIDGMELRVSMRVQ